METRTIGGEVYTLVKRQRSGICIYKAAGTYARVGPPEVIGHHLLTHRHMESIGFPVARIIAEGTDGSDAYFIETSLGEQRLTEIFASEYSATGYISSDSFEMFQALAQKFLHAQIRSPESPRDPSSFADAVHLEHIKSELPQYAETIQDRFVHRFDAIKNYPFRLMHGDFNPANMYPDGIIDFEDASSGPVGYDMICAIETADWFPMDARYEFTGKYRFSDEQKTQFIERCNVEMTGAGLPSLSEAKDHFEFFRAIWLTVRMHQWPKLQQYRYDLFIKKYLS